MARLSFLHLAFLAGPFAFSPLASSAEPSAACRDAYLQEFRVEGTKDALDGKDLCQQNAADLPAKFRAAFLDAKEVHERVAGALSLEPATLFGAGVKFKLKVSPGGMNGVYIDDNRQLELGAFPEAAAWISKAVYAHELGHWIADSRNPAVPTYFRDSRLTFLLDETLPDTLALATYGMLSDRDPTLPACMVPRTVDGQQSYATSIDTFAASIGPRRIQACCESSKGALNPLGEGLCAAINAQLSEEPPPPLRPGMRFSVKAALEDLSRVDNHQIGVPINSFLFAVGKSLGRPLYAEFLQTAGKAKGESLLCRLGAGKKAESVKVEVIPFGHLLDSFYGLLRPNERKIFEAQAKAHRLEDAVEFDHGELSLKAESQAINAMLPKLKPSHRCYEDLQQRLSQPGAEEPRRGCEMSCRPI